jgi:elongation factor P
MGTTSDLRTGLIIKYNNELHEVLDYEHRTPGNKRGFYQVKLKNLKNGRIIENKFSSGDELNVIRLESRDFQYLYHDGSGYVFMDLNSYDQVSVSDEIAGEENQFLKEGEHVQIMFNAENPVNFELPPHVELRVIEAPPGVKGDTATGGTKQVKVETGAVIKAPLFINENDLIKVDTRTGVYLERVKK